MSAPSADRGTPHEFDGVGVCIWCNQCDDPMCCAQKACTGSLLSDWTKATQLRTDAWRDADA